MEGERSPKELHLEKELGIVNRKNNHERNKAEENNHTIYKDYDL